MLISAPSQARLQVLTGFGCFGLFWGAWGAALPAIEHSTGVTNSQLGIALLLVGLGALLSMRFTGQLLDKFGYQTIVIALAAFSVAGVLPSIANGMVLLSIFTLVLGASSGAVDVCINALAIDYERRYEVRVLNTAHATFSICVVASSLIVSSLRSLSAPVWALLLVSQGIIFVVTLIVMPSQTPWGPSITFSRETSKASEIVVPHERSIGFRDLIIIPAILYFLGSLGAIAYLVENAWQSWSAILLQNGLGASATLSSVAPSVFAGSEAVGRLLGNPLGRWVRPRFLLAGGGAIAAVGSVITAQTSSVGIALLSLAVTGIGTSMCAPAILGLAGRTKSNLGHGATVSSVTTLSYVGFLVGPALVGILSGLKSLVFAMTVVGGLAAVLAVISLVGLRLPAANSTSLSDVS